MNFTEDREADLRQHIARVSWEIVTLFVSVETGINTLQFTYSTAWRHHASLLIM